jgi:ABC-2 type transport system permease protein
MMVNPDTVKPQVEKRSSLYWVISDTWELFKRSLIQIRRTPGSSISWVILQPVLFIVLFRYVFGGAINTGDTSYANFLIPGIIGMNAIFVSTYTSVGIATDMTNGFVDRLRSLPMRISAIFGGTVLSDSVRTMLGLVAMVLVGLLVGFRPHASLVAWLAATGIVLLVTYAFSWLNAVFGLLAKNVEGAQQMGMILFPLTFASSAFVPTQSMPSWLRGFAANQPVTQTVDAIRGLLLNQPVGNHGWMTVIWSVGIIAISIPLAGLIFKRRFS